MRGFSEMRFRILREVGGNRGIGGSTSEVRSETGLVSGNPRRSPHLYCRAGLQKPAMRFSGRKRVTGIDRGLLRSVLGPGYPVPTHFIWKNSFPWHPGPAAKVTILRFKNLPPFRHDPDFQIPRLRYSPGLAPTTRLNALPNAASDS